LFIRARNTASWRCLTRAYLAAQRRQEAQPKKIDRSGRFRDQNSSPIPVTRGAVEGEKYRRPAAGERERGPGKVVIEITIEERGQ